jgi:serine/threonine protein kinase
MPIIDTTLSDRDGIRKSTDTSVDADPQTPVPGRSDDDPGPELGTGDLVGRYRIVERLGAGGMGVVYRAHDPQLEREVALKLLRAKPGGEQQLMASRMLREAKSAARIRHSNVVTVYDAGEVSGRAFIAMELMSGTDLAKWFSQRRPWREVVRVMLQAAQGLRAAHESGIVHRDFKPDNVVLEDDGNVKVLDFGLARVAYDGETQSRVAEELAGALAATGIEGLDTLTHTGALVGTPAYMAPEQYLQQPLDARTDQFSFCVALFLGVYGHRPFGGRTHAALTMNVVQGNIENPEEPGVAPARLLDILRKGLATDPEQRFASMDALIGELRALLEREHEHATRVRKRRWIAGGVGVVLAGVIVAAVLRIELRVEKLDDVEADSALTEPHTTERGEPTEPPAPEQEPAPTRELPLELAVGRGRNKPVDGPQIWISPDTLRVITNADEAPIDVPLQAGLVVDSTTERVAISPVIEALARVSPDAAAAAFDPLTLYVDRQTPFATIVRAVFSGGRAGFARYDFAVRTGADIRVFEVEPPLFGGDGQLRRLLALELDVRADRVFVGAQLWAPNDLELAQDPMRWPIDVGSGSCELPLGSGEATALEPLGRLTGELCALGGVGVPIIVTAGNDVTWEQLAAVLGAALPSPECSRGVVLQAGASTLDGCANPVAIEELKSKLAQPSEDADASEPEFRRWCFINSSLKNKKVCRSTRAACISEAQHWVDKPRQSCEGER